MIPGSMHVVQTWFGTTNSAVMSQTSQSYARLDLYPMARTLSMTGEEVMRETWPDQIIERCGAAATKWMLDDTGESAPRWFRKAKALSSILMIDADQHSLERMRRVGSRAQLTSVAMRSSRLAPITSPVRPYLKRKEKPGPPVPEMK